MKRADATWQGTPFERQVAAAEPLAQHTTLGVGGPADYYIEATTEDQAAAILLAARQRRIPALVLGGGSNVVVADGGWRGIVVRPLLRQLVVRHDAAGAFVEAGAGVVWDDLVSAATAEGLAGLEGLSGIPGLVGAAPIQNIGAYGQEASETITAVRAVDRETGVARTLDRSECSFGYRTSTFKRAGAATPLITSVTFQLRRSEHGTARYVELAAELGVSPGDSAPLSAVREAVLAIRARKSMLLSAADPNSQSVGSFFVNPIVSADAADAVEAVARRRTVRRSMPRWPAADGRVKLSAAWLIEGAGFSRGDTVGRVGLSANHTLAIVNRGGATAAEVIHLAARIQAEVRGSFGVQLEPEPQFLGFAEGNPLASG